MNNGSVGFRAIDGAVISERIVHRVERVPNWRPSDKGPNWRSLCGTRVGETRRGGLFEFDVAVALDPDHVFTKVGFASVLEYSKQG